jgi:4,5-dihydroxyphthalate decarboxylase
MARTYPASGPVRLKLNLADSPLTAALKAGTVSSPLITFDFSGPKIAHDGFKPMVREEAFDGGELAIVTFLQAKNYGKPYVLLPAAVVGRFQHATISYMAGRGIEKPKDMEERKVAVRAYTQTTGTWARGILHHEYGVDLSGITWITTDDPHLAEYTDPANVVRVSKAEKSLDQRMIDGEADAGILGLNRPAHRDAQLMIPDPEAAAEAWYAKYGCTHINHMFVVHQELAQQRPDVVEELYRLLKESKAAAGLPKGKVDPLPFGFENVRRSINIIAQYAHEQKIVDRQFEVDDLFSDLTREL